MKTPRIVDHRATRTVEKTTTKIVFKAFVNNSEENLTLELRGDCIGDLRLSKEGEVFFRNSLKRYDCDNGDDDNDHDDDDDDNDDENLIAGELTGDMCGDRN